MWQKLMEYNWNINPISRIPQAVKWPCKNCYKNSQVENSQVKALSAVFMH